MATCYLALVCVLYVFCLLVVVWFSALAAVCTVDCAIKIVLITLHLVLSTSAIDCKDSSPK